jgi:glucokinase
MRPFQVITRTQMKTANRLAVLDLIRRKSPIVRDAIARILQLSPPTVTAIVKELMAEGLVRSFEQKKHKSRLLEFNAGGQLVIAIDLGGTKMYGAVADLGGTILYEETIAHHATTGEASYDSVAGLVERLLQCCRQNRRTVRGIGVGAPGITHSRPGIVHWAPSLEWRDFPLKERLTARFRLPVIVENDVNLAALGEAWFGAGKGTNNLVLVAVGTGIGGGVVLDGALYHGAHEMAGEFGYLLPDRSRLGQSYDGFGALEQLASGSGVAERARRALGGKLAPEKLAGLTAESVFDAARQGEPWAKEVVNETVDYLAQAVAALALCFDPEMIVLGGGVARSADLLIEPLRKRLSGVIPLLPELVASSLGQRAAVMGTIIELLYIST